MATRPDTDTEQRAPASDEPLSLQEIVQAENIAELLTETERNEIGTRCLRGYEIDRNSRSDWLKRHNDWLDAAMQKPDTKDFPWPNASNIKFPILLTSSLQFQARAYPAIVPGSNVAKAKVVGPDPQGEKASRATRVGLHMDYQLLEQMPGWEEDTDRLLLALPIVGCAFRKSYYDDVRRTNISSTVPAENFVINYWAKSIESAPRYTQIMPMYPHEVREYVTAGLWRDVSLEPDSGDESPEKQQDGDDEQALGDMLEQHCLLDLDKDGYPEPYIVTMNRGGDVACIRACFDERGVTQNEAGEVVRIERHQYFVKYGFLPAPDGSFYDMGFGMLLESLSKNINGSINRMMDAGTMQNAGGGFIGAGINIRGGNITVGPQRWNRVDVTGGTLRENIVPLEHSGPSAVLFNLLGLLIDSAKGITSVQDILTGAEQTANTPATTTLARIEQGMKVMTGIFKRIHRAFGRELKILFRLNGAYLDEQVYAELNDTPIQVGRADYQQDGLDIRPVSDPTVVTDMQAIMRATALMELRGDPRFEQDEIAKRYLEALNVPEAEKLLVKKPPDDPALMLEIEKQGDAHVKALSEVRRNDAAAVQSLAAAIGALGTAGLLADTADVAGALVALADKIMGEVDGRGTGEPADEGGDPAAMEGAPADAGVPGLPGTPPGEPDAGMGLGQALGLGGPAGGVPVQPAPSPGG